LGYIGLHLVLGLLALWQDRVNLSALIYSLLSNLRFVTFFVICLVVARQNSWLETHWKHVVLIPAAAVVGFGLLQHFLLPVDWLRHFGYGPNTIPAYQAVDQKLAYARLQSSLRGANPLGAYLVLIIAVLTALILKAKKWRGWWWVSALLAGIALFFTYSRSAWIGAAAAVLIILWRSLQQPQLKRYLLIGLAACALIGLGGVYVLRNNDHVQNTLFHTDEHSLSSDSSNFDRLGHLKNGLKDIAHEPWGGGPGTAGPASVRNPERTRLAENYYLQIGQEVGVVGLLIFISINILVAAALFKQSGALSLALFASLIGLTIVNMLSHAWGDDTLGLLWWGLAGIALAPSIRQSRT
jgi:hypothetical protein